MEFPYKPPVHLEYLVKTSARTEVGWGINEDGTVEVQHIMSSNPFANRSDSWGVASIDDNGDIGIVSQGPGNAVAEEDLPPDLIKQLVQFYEKEGLNVRNISEVDPAAKTAEIDQGLALCPECHSTEVYVTPDGPMGHSDHFDCENCGYHGHQDELEDGDVDPDPDRNQRDDEQTGTQDDYEHDDWDNYVSNKQAAGEAWSTQGTVVVAAGGIMAQGIAISPKQSKEEIEALVGDIYKVNPPIQQQKKFVDLMNRGEGTSFPPGDSPYINRGGSIYAQAIEDHFFETKDAAEPNPNVEAPIGIPGTGIGDPRNFEGPQNTPGYILVAEYTTTEDYPLFASPRCYGVVAKIGGTTSHAALVARELNIPVISEVENFDRIQPGDNIRMDPTSGRVDINGGDPDFQVGEQRRARTEVVRFVWSKGNLAHSPVVQGLDETSPFSANGTPDRSHYAMIEWLDEQGLYDWEDGTIGIVYDDGTAEYYEPISDEPALTNALKSNFPDAVQNVVYKQTQGGIYGPTEVTAEIKEEAPQCPNCDSHSYTIINFPDVSGDNGELRCLNCGTDYSHIIYMNPKGSALEDQGQGTTYPTDPEAQKKVIDVMHQIAQASQQGNRSEVIRLQEELERLLGGNPNLPTVAMQKGAPYPENSDKNAPDHSPKGQKLPKKVNSIYNACMREGNGSGDTKEEKKSSCMAIAWAQYKKIKKSKLVHHGIEFDETWDEDFEPPHNWLMDELILEVKGLMMSGMSFDDALTNPYIKMISNRVPLEDRQSAIDQLRLFIEGENTTPDIGGYAYPYRQVERQGPQTKPMSDREMWKNVMKAPKNDPRWSAEDKVGPVEPTDAPGGALKPGTRVEVLHRDKKGQKGTIVDYHGKDGAFEDDAYEIVLDSGERIKGVREVDLKRIKRSSTDIVNNVWTYGFTVLAEDPMAPFGNPQNNINDLRGPCPFCHAQPPAGMNPSPGDWRTVTCSTCRQRLPADDYVRLQQQDRDTTPGNTTFPAEWTAAVALNDTNGAPIQIGKLYLMHSTQYKVPDIVRIVAVDPNRIEAHIDSDARGMFPIDISAEDFASLGYSFEPYEGEKIAGIMDSFNLLRQRGDYHTWSDEQRANTREQLMQHPENDQANDMVHHLQNVEDVIDHVRSGDNSSALYAANLLSANGHPTNPWAGMNGQDIVDTFAQTHGRRQAIVDENTTALYEEVLQALHGQPTSDEARQVAQDLLNTFGPTDRVLRLIPDADALSNFLNYDYTAHTAARKIRITQKRQGELINENIGAKARNFDKLNLEGTHYTMWELIERPGEVTISDHFIF